MLYVPHQIPSVIDCNKMPSTLPQAKTQLLEQERPTLLVDIVLKVMTRLYYSGKGTTLTETENHDGTLLFSHPQSFYTSTQHYQELFELKELIVTLIQRAPSRNSKALTITVIQALLLSHRILAHNQTDPELYPLPAALCSPKSVFLASLTLSEACLMDCQTSTRIWGRIAGLLPSQVANLKTSALVYLQFNVHVGAQEFAWWCQVVMQWMKLVGGTL
ncbi:hypothetical protein BDR26DRAFT_853459 [Obelidium mucronatum]|nr:hypothetical protein BDR26DRAFT_853459 [Obelidium mucronatum]